METLIARIRSSDRWDEAVVSDVLETIDRASREGMLAELREELVAPEGGSGDAGPADILRDLIRAGDGDLEARGQVEAFLERLNQGGHWELLGPLAVGMAEFLNDPALCRYVARAGEESDLEALPDGTLDRALAIAPDNHRLLWLKAQRLEQRSDPTSLEYVALALPGWAHAKEIARIDDGLLKLLESPNADQWRIAWNAVADLARQGETRPMTSFLELGLEQMKPLGLTDTLWTTLRRMMETGQTTKRIRKVAAEVARNVHGDIKAIDLIIDRSGLGSPDSQPKKTLQEFDRLLKYAPGLMVNHKGFGYGTIKDTDGETLTIDFKDKEGHRMSLAIAERSLDILPPDDITTLILTEPESLKAMRKEDPVALLELALKKVGGEGSNSDIRKLLVPAIMSAQSWPGWWKKVTEKAKDDERIDTSQIFRRVYRLPETGESAGILPLIQERADLHQNLDMIRRFLDQHPEQQDEARRVYRPRLAQWLGSIDKPDARVHLLHVLRRWDESLKGEFIEVLGDYLDAGGELTFTTLESEQLEILDAAAEADLGAKAALALLPSRHRAVRLRAAETLRRDLGDDLPRVIRELYSRAPNDEVLIMGLVEFGLEDPEALPQAMEEPGYAFQAVIMVVQAASREPSRRQALALLKPGGRAAAALRERPLSEDRYNALLRVLTDWRTTDRHLFPVLDFFSSGGAEALVDGVKQYRTERSAELVARAKAAGEEAGVFMTRGSIERLRDEIQSIELALRTTIPESIRKAREHGDLSENAEYDAAKDKQRAFNQRLGRLQETLRSARAIEEANQVEGVVGLGSEVRVLDLNGGTESTYWILGEGDAIHGEHVISYQAPLGRGLMGSRVGNEITVPLEDGEHRMRVLEVRLRLPEATSAE